MIDTYESIKDLLTFDSKDDFYYLQILQRKKENPQIGSNSRVVKNYYITSTDYLESRYEEIKDLCNSLNARAMLRLNKRSFEKIAFKTIQNLANSIANKEYKSTRNSYDRACGTGHNDKNKKWILDIDDDLGIEDLIKITGLIQDSQPGEDNIILDLETKNGFHLITKPFDSREIKELYPTLSIHKDNPINLYIP
jgi:hypothetical protein